MPVSAAPRRRCSGPAACSSTWHRCVRRSCPTTPSPTSTRADPAGTDGRPAASAVQHRGHPPRCRSHRTARGLAGPMVNVMLFHQKMTLGDIEGEYHIVTSGPVEDLLVNFFQSGSPTKHSWSPGESRTLLAEALHTHHRRFPRTGGGVRAGLRRHAGRRHPRREFGGGCQLLRTAAQLEFWSRELAGLPDILSLPSDRPRRQARPRQRPGGLRDPRGGAPGRRRAVRGRGCTVFAAVHARWWCCWHAWPTSTTSRSARR